MPCPLDALVTRAGATIHFTENSFEITSSFFWSDGINFGGKVYVAVFETFAWPFFASGLLIFCIVGRFLLFLLFFGEGKEQH